MTKVYRDGLWQSVSEKSHPQDIPGGERWTALRWVGDDGKPQRTLWVLHEGPQDFDYAIRIRSIGNRFAAGTWVWARIQRYPIDTVDAGTRWQGPFLATTNESAFYLTGRSMDDKGGKVGAGYGVDVKSTKPVRIDQYLPKLDPRHYP